MKKGFNIKIENGRMMHSMNYGDGISYDLTNDEALIVSKVFGRGIMEMQKFPPGTKWNDFEGQRRYVEEQKRIDNMEISPLIPKWLTFCISVALMFLCFIGGAYVHEFISPISTWLGHIPWKGFAAGAGVIVFYAVAFTIVIRRERHRKGICKEQITDEQKVIDYNAFVYLDACKKIEILRQNNWKDPRDCADEDKLTKEKLEKTMKEADKIVRRSKVRIYELCKDRDKPISKLSLSIIGVFPLAPIVGYILA